MTQRSPLSTTTPFPALCSILSSDTPSFCTVLRKWTLLPASLELPQLKGCSQGHMSPSPPSLAGYQVHGTPAQKSVSLASAVDGSRIVCPSTASTYKSWEAVRKSLALSDKGDLYKYFEVEAYLRLSKSRGYNHTQRDRSVQIRGVRDC